MKVHEILENIIVSEQAIRHRQTLKELMNINDTALVYPYELITKNNNGWEYRFFADHIQVNVYIEYDQRSFSLIPEVFSYYNQVAPEEVDDISRNLSSDKIRKLFAQYGSCLKVIFTVGTGSEETMKKSDSGKRQVRIFATVLNILAKHSSDAICIVFDANINEKSRVKMFDRMAKNKMQQLGFSLLSIKDDFDRTYTLINNKVKSPISEHTELLLNSPLPDDWDSNVYSPDVSFKKRIDYAVARAQKMGTGSSRIAFEIEYQGRPTILKIAKNAKGMAQNEAEAGILDDYFIEGLGVTVPLIDYDEINEQPVWIHLEKATKATPKQLCNLLKCGDALTNLVYVAAYNIGKRRQSVEGIMDHIHKNFNYSDEDIETFEEYAQALSELGHYGLELADFTRAANWGIYNGKPVIIDVGATDYVMQQYYSGKR